MGQLELFPVTQIASSGTYAVTGAASVVAALNDASDASYIKNSGATRASAGFLMDPLSGLPAGAKVRSVQSRMRYTHADRPGTPYEVIRPVTALVGRQLTSGKHVFDGYHTGLQLLDWSAATAVVQQLTFPSKQQTYDGKYFADLMVLAGRRLYMSIETFASPSTLNVARLYSASLLVNYDELPTINVTAPTGTHNISRPTITWDYSDPEGYSQVVYDVRIFTAAQVAAPGFSVDTTVPIYSASRWSQLPRHTPEGNFYQGDGVYHAYVRAAHVSVGNQQMFSAWDSISFTLDLEEPTAPTILADYDSATNLVMIEVQNHDNMLTWNQSSGELTTTAGFTADASTTVTNTSAQASHGVRSIQYTRSGTTGTASFRTTGGTGGVPVTAGDVYIALADVRTQTTARSVSVGISWYDAAGALLSTTTGVASNDASGAWGQRYVIGKAPVGAVTAAVVVSAAAVVVAENHYADKLSITLVDDHAYSQEDAAELAAWQAGTNTTIALSTAQAYNGTSSMSMTRTTSTGDATAHTFPGLFGIPAMAGETVQASARFRAAAVSRVCSVLIRFYDISQVLITAANTQTTASDTTTGWVEATASVVAPVGTVWAEIEVKAAGALVAEVHYVDRIMLNLYASRTWTRGGFVGDSTVIVAERSIDLGVTWQVFRDSLVAGEHQVSRIDGELRSTAEVWYRAKVEAEDQDGDPMTSLYSPIERIVLPAIDSWWLRNPRMLPDQNMRLRVRSHEGTRARPQVSANPLESTTAVVSHHGLKSEILDLEIDLLSQTTHDDFWAMVEDGRTLVLINTIGDLWYVQAGESTRIERYRAYPTPTEPWPIRHAHKVDMTFIEVAQPSG